MDISERTALAPQHRLSPPLGLCPPPLLYTNSLPICQLFCSALACQGWCGAWPEPCHLQTLSLDHQKSLHFSVGQERLWDPIRRWYTARDGPYRQRTETAHMCTHWMEKTAILESQSWITLCLSYLDLFSPSDLKDAETLPNHCLRLSCGHSITERFVCTALHTITNSLTFTSSIRTPKTFSLPSHHIITHTDTYKHIHKYRKDSLNLRNKGRLLNNTIIIIITTSLT